jgi:hypothetical protein
MSLHESIHNAALLSKLLSGAARVPGIEKEGAV